MLAEVVLTYVCPKTISNVWQIYSVLGYFFPARREAAFSTFKLMQALSTAIGFFFAKYAGTFFFFGF